jgi:hypothetical protein
MYAVPLVSSALCLRHHAVSLCAVVFLKAPQNTKIKSHFTAPVVYYPLPTSPKWSSVWCNELYEICINYEHNTTKNYVLTTSHDTSVWLWHTVAEYSCNCNASIFVCNARIWLYNEGKFLSDNLFGQQSRISKENKAVNLNQFGYVGSWW